LNFPRAERRHEISSEQVRGELRAPTPGRSARRDSAFLTGHRPFEGTPAEIIAAALTTSIPDPRAYAPDVPQVAALVCRLGALDRAARPADGQAAADAIESAGYPT
jgi:hypothetical protein